MQIAGGIIQKADCCVLESQVQRRWKNQWHYFAMPHLSYLGYRHVVVLLTNIGLLLVYCMRVNLSVALIAMVATNDTDGPVSNECPSDITNLTDVQYVGQQFDWSKDTQGLILSSFFWGYILLQVPAGRWAQQYGGKLIFGLGVSSTAVLTILTPLVAGFSVYLFIVLRFLEGMCESVCYPTVLAMLGRWSPREESTLLLALSISGGVIGTIVGQMMAGPICESPALGGWPTVFYISGGAGLVWLVPWMFFIYNSPTSHPYISEEEKNYITQSTGGLQESTNRRSVPWKRILTSRVIHVYTFCTFVHAWVKYTFLTCLPQFLSNVLHFDLTMNAIIASLPYVFYLVFSNGLSWLCETCVKSGWIRKGIMKRTLNIIAFGGCGVCLFAVPPAKCNSDLIITLLVLGYTLFSAVVPGLFSNALDLSPEYSGIVFGIGNMVSTMAGIASPLVTDAITGDETLAEWNIIFYTSAGASVLAGVIYGFFGSTKRQLWHIDVDVLRDGETSRLIVNSEDVSQK